MLVILSKGFVVALLERLHWAIRSGLGETGGEFELQRAVDLNRG